MLRISFGVYPTKPRRLFQRMMVMLSKYQSGRGSVVKIRKSWYCALTSVLLSKLRMTYGLTLPLTPLQSALTYTVVRTKNSRISSKKEVSPEQGKYHLLRCHRISEQTFEGRRVQSVGVSARLG